MTAIEKLLDVGDLRSAGNVEKVIKQVMANPALFEDVINTIFSDKPATKMRASDVVEKISRDNPKWLSSYKKLFLNKVILIQQKEVRWHLAQILPRFKLTTKEREQVYKLMLSFLKDNSSIVKTFALQAITDIALQDSRYMAKAKRIINTSVKTGTPAMQSRGKKLLVQLYT